MNDNREHITDSDAYSYAVNMELMNLVSLQEQQKIVLTRILDEIKNPEGISISENAQNGLDIIDKSFKVIDNLKNLFK